MQFRRGLIIIFLFFLAISPIRPASAASLHYSTGQLEQGLVFEVKESGFKLNLAKTVWQKPVDAYLYLLTDGYIGDQIHALGPVYSYFIFSDEVDESTEFTVTLDYLGDNPYAKTVYYWNSQRQAWQMASQRAFINNLTFKIQGKSNRLVIAGSNTENLTLDQLTDDKKMVSKIYTYSSLSAEADLIGQATCQPYLTTELSKTKGDKADVVKLQTFLNKFEGQSALPATGYFGAMTENAVTAFQEKYTVDILKPSGLTRGSGLVYALTLKKINELYCTKYQELKTYEFSLGYELPSTKAKSFYYQSPGGDWLKLESFDNHKTKTVTGLTSQISLQVALFEEPKTWIGEASWYAYQGGLFAASRDFPKGTRLKVINQSADENRGQSVIVTVNDYGPMLSTGRIIDLDKVAFDRLGNLRDGVMPIKLEVSE